MSDLGSVLAGVFGRIVCGRFERAGKGDRLEGAFEEIEVGIEWATGEIEDGMEWRMGKILDWEIQSPAMMRSDASAAAIGLARGER